MRYLHSLPIGRVSLPGLHGRERIPRVYVDYLCSLFLFRVLTNFGGEEEEEEEASQN